MLPHADAAARLHDAAITAATAADLDDVGRLAYATAFFGTPAAEFFPAPSLFAELWVAPYLAAGHGLVARARGEAIGYCLGVDRPGAYLWGLCRRSPHLIRAIAHERGRVPALRYGLRALASPRPTAPRRRFPAHLHLAVAAEARGSGLGRLLLVTYLEAACVRGVRGVQLATTEAHSAAVHLYRSEGFVVWEARESSLWRPWVGRPVRHLVMTLDVTAWSARRESTPAAAAPD